MFKGRSVIFRKALLNIQIFYEVTLSYAEYLQTTGAGSEKVQGGGRGGGMKLKHLGNTKLCNVAIRIKE
jgi:hypothetical protein